VLGLQVVLASGEVLELNGALEKNNTGPDLRQLFIGSEGILGVITEATLKLTRVPRDLQVMVFAVPTLQAVIDLFKSARRGPFHIMAYEFFTEACQRRLRAHRKLRPPFEHESPYYVLLEAEHVEAAGLNTWVSAAFETGLATDGVVASGAGQAAELWALREGISESLSATGMPHKNDIALPIARLTAFCEEMEALLAKDYPGWEICLFGHIGDGNLHVNIMKPDALDKATFLARTKAVDHDIFALVQKHQGSISAEHGVGLLKKDFLPYSRSAEEITLIKALKRALDPRNILNPGKVIDA
jgi:FAD/FMN-containing dehydrogenase